MSFRLVLKSVTFNDLDQRNGSVFCVISPNSVAFWAYYVKWLKIHTVTFCKWNVAERI